MGGDPLDMTEQTTTWKRSPHVINWRITLRLVRHLSSAGRQEGSALPSLLLSASLFPYIISTEASIISPLLSFLVFSYDFSLIIESPFNISSLLDSYFSLRKFMLLELYATSLISLNQDSSMWSDLGITRTNLGSYFQASMFFWPPTLFSSAQFARFWHPHVGVPDYMFASRLACTFALRDRERALLLLYAILNFSLSRAESLFG